MSADQDWSRRRSRNFQTLALPPQDIPDKRSFFNPAMNPRLLEGFNRRCLGIGEAGLRAAFGKCPAPAAAGLDQQKLDKTPPDPVANCSNLLAPAHLPELRHTNRLNRRLGPNNRRNISHTQNTIISDSGTHRHRVHQPICFCLEHTLVRRAKGLQLGMANQDPESFCILAPAL